MFPSSVPDVLVAVPAHWQLDTVPRVTTLRRIAAVLDKELLLGFQRIENGALERDFAGVVA